MENIKDVEIKREIEELENRVAALEEELAKNKEYIQKNESEMQIIKDKIENMKFSDPGSMLQSLLRDIEMLKRDNAFKQIWFYFACVVSAFAAYVAAFYLTK